MDSRKSEETKDFVGLHGEPRSFTHPDPVPGGTGSADRFIPSNPLISTVTGTGIRKGKKGIKPKRSVSWSHVAFAKSIEKTECEQGISMSSPMASGKADLDSIFQHYGLNSTSNSQKDNVVARDDAQTRKLPSFSEHSRRLTAFGVSLTTTLSDVILVYPCLVLRRQCQVSNVGRRYHFTPFTIIGVAVSLQRSQGFTCLWKGVGSHLMINALSFGIESGLNEMSEELPREVDRHSKIKDLMGHVILKAISSAIIMPFYSAHLVESIQSEAASETPGLFYFLTEGFSRLFGLAGVQSRRMLPFRHLLLPTVLYFLTKYIFSTCLQYGILSALRFRERRKHEDELSNAHPFSPTDSSYMAVPQGLSLRTRHSGTPTLSMAKNLTNSQHHELLSNFISQLVTDVLLYPYETALFRIHVQGTRTIIDDMDKGAGFLPVSSRYETFLDCLCTVKANEGSGGLYRGFGALLLQYSMKFVVLKLLNLVIKTS